MAAPSSPFDSTRKPDHDPRRRDVAAHVIAGEVGLDMTRFPTSSHLSRGPDSARASTRAPASIAPVDPQGCPLA